MLFNPIALEVNHTINGVLYLSRQPTPGDYLTHRDEELYITKLCGPACFVARALTDPLCTPLYYFYSLKGRTWCFPDVSNL